MYVQKVHVDDRVTSVSHLFCFRFLMIRRPPRSTRTDTLFPYTTLCRSMSFDEIARLAAAHHRPVGQDRWVSDRLARHSVAEGGHVQALSDGRWVQINELRTSEGGIVGIYTDITEAKIGRAHV